jgi:hypothetical protein
VVVPIEINAERRRGAGHDGVGAVVVVADWPAVASSPRVWGSANGVVDGADAVASDEPLGSVGALAADPFAAEAGLWAGTADLADPSAGPLVVERAD